MVERLVDAGLDSIRLSINSCRPALYERYFRPGATRSRMSSPRGGSSRKRRLASINYFMFPGVTDTEEELAALVRVVDGAGVRLIQTRCLNLDPDMYLAALACRRTRRGFGIDRWIERVAALWPHLRLGYFNPPREDWPPFC